MAKRTILRWTATLAVLGGAGVATAMVVARDGDATTAPAPDLFKTVAVASGTLSTTEKVDGTLERTSTLAVLHRIEGQSVAVTSGGTAGGSATGTAAGSSSAPQGIVAAAVTPTPGGTSQGGGLPGGGSGGAAGSGPSGAASAPTAGTGVGAGASSSARVTQTVTSVIAAGSTVGLGDVLYTVDSEPVVALFGPLPAWRTMLTSSTAGPDIAQLESSLVALGYDPDGEVTVDEEFDAATEAMVERWQQGLGREATGEVTLGSAVFIPEATRVAAVTVAVGDAVGEGDEIAELAGSSQQVVIDVPDGDERFVVPGLAVRLGGSATGRVLLLRSAEQSGAVVVQAVIVPDETISDVADGGALTVTITIDAATGALIVPSEALLSRLDGSYAVEVRAADGAVTWHTVEVLGISGNQAAVRGDGIAEGTAVLVPA